MNRDLHGNTHIKKNILFLFPYAVFHKYRHLLYVKVTIEAEEKGQYTYKDKKLTFVIKATQVEVEGEPLENFSVTTFSFDMVKK